MRFNLAHGAISFGNQSTIILMYIHSVIVFEQKLITGGMLDCHGGFEAVESVCMVIASNYNGCNGQ
jgi:hypothetical protein